MRFRWSRRERQAEGYAVLSGRWWSLRAEWDLWSRFCAAEIEGTYEGAWKLMLAFPPIAVWLTFSLPLRIAPEREISVSIHDWALWWNFWCDPNCWDSRIPRWRQGAWHPIDTLLGRAEYSKVEVGTHAVLIPMPEGCYPATATFERCTWKRPRWFARVRDFTKVDIGARGGIPHEGKGENSWDCGIDGLCGYSTAGHDLDAAIADGVARSLRYRQRRDGSRWAKYPTPAASPAPGGGAP
jgi:hypothetical protein